MKIIALFIFATIFTSNAFSVEIFFKDGNFQYKAVINEEQMTLKSRFIDLKSTHPCLKKERKGVARRFQNLMKLMTLTKVEEEAYRVKVDGKRYNIFKSSRLGRFLYQLPFTVEQSVALEKNSCS